MGGEPKQFRLLDGRPTVCWAARALLEALAGPVIVVLPEESAHEGEGLLRGHLQEAADRIRITAGGTRRQDSVKRGLDALAGAATVLVHDAARPFATAGLVERVARRAAAGRAVVPAVPIHDTLKEIDGPRIIRTHDRHRFVAAQTPQGFPIELLFRAHDEAGEGEATDDACLCEAAGIPVVWIPGERMNRKLTDSDDWAWAEEAVAAGRLRWQ